MYFTIRRCAENGRAGTQRIGGPTGTVERDSGSSLVYIVQAADRSSHPFSSHCSERVVRRNPTNECARACGKCSGGGDDDGSGGVTSPHVVTTRSVSELYVRVSALRTPRNVVTVRSIPRTRTSSSSHYRSTIHIVQRSFLFRLRSCYTRACRSCACARSSGELSDCSASKARQRNRRTQEPCDSRGCLQPRCC